VEVFAFIGEKDSIVQPKNQGRGLHFTSQNNKLHKHYLIKYMLNSLGYFLKIYTY